MREATVGRLLVASLHQAIADLLPTRLGFYEGWLTTDGMRDGTIGLAPVSAVLSFLRQEGTAYEPVVRLAGEYAADWTVASMAPFERKILLASPPWLRFRLLLWVAGRFVRRTCRRSYAVHRVRGGIARVSLTRSVFCAVRQPVAHPLCAYYAAAFTRLLSHFGLRASAAVVGCRGAGEPKCLLTIPWSGALVGGVGSMTHARSPEVA